MPVASGPSGMLELDPAASALLERLLQTPGTMVPRLDLLTVLHAVRPEASPELLLRKREAGPLDTRGSDRRSCAASDARPGSVRADAQPVSLGSGLRCHFAGVNASQPAGRRSGRAGSRWRWRFTTSASLRRAS